MAKLSKMAGKCMNMGGGMGSGLVTIAIYLVIAYVFYKVLMYLFNMRTSAMPNVPPPRRNGGGCATGTCGAGGGTTASM
jgi:hypothetical protein